MLGFLIGSISTLIALIIIATLNPDLELFKEILENIAIIQAIGSLSIACSAIVAFLLFRLNLNRHKSEDAYKKSNTFLKEATNNLERVFEIFTDDSENISPPRNDRLLWLTTARMLLRFNKLRQKVNILEHIDIIEEHEEYWRFKFHKLLNENKSNFTKNYFNPSSTFSSGNCIEISSIAVIFNFAQWKEGAKDLIEEVDDKLLFAKGVIPINQLGIIEFLKEKEQYWTKVEEIKKSLNNDS